MPRKATPERSVFLHHPFPCAHSDCSNDKELSVMLFTLQATWLMSHAFLRKRWEEAHIVVTLLRLAMAS